MKAIYKREMKMYFNSMTGYVFIAFFVLITAVYFSMMNILSMSPQFEYVLSSVIMMFLILGPMLTMRLLTEETRYKTDQLLLTSPISISGIVVGKYLAAVSVFLIALLITGIFPAILSIYGNIATVKIMGSYFGFLLLGGVFIAIGLWISSLTDNQIVAAVGTFVAIFLLIMEENIASWASGSVAFSLFFSVILAVLIAFYFYNNTKSKKYSGGLFGVLVILIAVAYAVKPILFDGFAGKFASMFSVLTRYNYFAMGIFDMSAVVYMISFIIVFLYFTVRVIEKKRWS